MDEPTAALSGVEVERLFAVARSLRDEGRALVFISHRFDEVFALCDTITVMRDGSYVATHRTEDTSSPAIVAEMVGREVADLFPKTPAEIGEPVLEVEGLQSRGVFHDVSFTVRARGDRRPGRTRRRRPQRDRPRRLRRGRLRRRPRPAQRPRDPPTQPPRRHRRRHGLRAGGPAGAGPRHRGVRRPQRGLGDPGRARPGRAAHHRRREPGGGSVGRPARGQDQRPGHERRAP